MVGALIAGGLGLRMGGGKPQRPLAGRALASYPAAALSEVCSRVLVVAKADTPLPDLAGLDLVLEPDLPLHPLTGLVQALETAGEEVLVCAADMPFVTAGALDELIAAAQPPATIAVAGGRLQPLLGVYFPVALDALRAAEPDDPLTRTVEALEPALVELPAQVARSVDTPEQLAAAEEELRR